MDVLIIGAGIGGLTLGGLLAREVPDAEVTILERDHDLRSRPQGYGVGLRGWQGLAVLDRLGVGDEVEALAQSLDSFTLLTPRGRILRRARPSRRDPAERLVVVPRSALRRLLVEACGPETVRFGAAVVNIAPGERPRVGLEGGESIEADLVVAADGSRSLARRLLLGRDLSYVGLARIGAVAPRLSHPLVDGGVAMTLGRGCSTFVQVLDERTFAWSFTTLLPEGGLADASPEELLSHVREATAGWHEPLPSIVASTDVAEVTSRGLYCLPSPSRARDRRVAFVGDAAHAMTPYRGVGANMAMVDAAELVDAVRAHGSLDDAVAAYEQVMLPRNRAAVSQSRNAAVSLHPAGRLGRLRRDTGLRVTGSLARLLGRG